MKALVIIGDGMADYPVARLGGRTPLMAAETPSMDWLAKNGRCGLFVTVPPDMPPGSEVANLTILGYDARTCHQGRGVLEAASLGIPLKPTDVAMRLNLICVENDRIKNHSAGHIPTAEGRELVSFLQQEWKGDWARLYPGLSYRHLLVLPAGSADIQCFPPHDHVGERLSHLAVTPLSKAARETAEHLNRMIRHSRELLPSHPVNQRRSQAGLDFANCIWPWSPGKKPLMKTLQERYGKSGAVISAVDLIKGVGIYAGMKVVHVPGATGLWDTDYEGKADAAVAALADHDLVYCHVEATDEAGHCRDLELKIKTIEYLDRRLISRILRQLQDSGIRATVAVLPDHPTPVELGCHVKDPVPVAVFDPEKIPDDVCRFDEVAVKTGALGVLQGARFMETVLGVSGNQGRIPVHKMQTDL